MSLTPRARFLRYIRDPKNARPVVSPFLPKPEVVAQTLAHLGLPVGDDGVQNEIRLSRELDYEPMFMTDLPGLIFPWQVDASRSDDAYEVSVIPTPEGEWVRRFPRKKIAWNEEARCPVQTRDDHKMLVKVCEQVSEREADIRRCFRRWRHRVGENGVIVIGHPHPSWLGYQISPQTIFYHWRDWPDAFRRSMDAIYRAALFVMAIALDEGIDFMSDSSYGLEMTSPALFAEMDLPYIQAFSAWTHERGGLFWYHNCGFTRKLILDGVFNRLGADLIETLAPPPEGDNDLAESRRAIAPSICTKGNFGLVLLRDGNPGEIARETRKMVDAVRGYPHIMSTADAVLPGTPPESFLAFVRTAREAVS